MVKDKSKVPGKTLSRSGDTGGDPSAQVRVEGPRGRGRTAQSSVLVLPFWSPHQGQGGPELQPRHMARDLHFAKW